MTMPIELNKDFSLWNGNDKQFEIEYFAIFFWKFHFIFYLISIQSHIIYHYHLLTEIAIHTHTHTSSYRCQNIFFCSSFYSLIKNKTKKNLFCFFLVEYRITNEFFFSFHDCYSSCCCMSYFFFSNWCIWFFFFITGSIVNLGLLPIFFCHCYISELFIIITIVVVVVVVPIIITFFFFDYFVHFIHRCDSGLFFHSSCISHFCTWDSVFIQFFSCSFV